MGGIVRGVIVQGVIVRTPIIMMPIFKSLHWLEMNLHIGYKLGYFLLLSVLSQPLNTITYLELDHSLTPL